MNLQNYYMQIAGLIIIFFVYTYLIFDLGDIFLVNPRLKRGGQTIVGIVNAIAIVAITIILRTDTVVGCACIGILILVEFLMFYKDNLLRIIALVLSFYINVLLVRSISVSVLAMIKGVSIQTLLLDNSVFINTFSLSFFILNILLVLLIKFLVKERARAAAEELHQLIFIVCWTGVVISYLLFVNTGIYIDEIVCDYAVQNQLALSITLLFGYFIVFFFTLQVGESVFIKKKNLELSQTIENEQQFKDAVIKDALNVYEINLSKDLLTRGFEEHSDLLKICSYTYSDLLEPLVPKYIYSDDIAMFKKYVSTKNLLEEYHRGKKVTEIVYRRLKKEGDYRWAKAAANLYEDNSSGDIYAFVYVKDIHEEKILEIELKKKAERDSLTNLYNKGTTEKLISDFVSVRSKRPHKGVLFIIDVDNYKMINDLLGHSFGDEVLCELSENLKNIFRSSPEESDSREDIVGRVGGDEFMIFMKNTTNRNLIIKKAERICKSFNKTYKTNNHTKITISSSIGIAIFPDHGTTFEDLYKRADIALYLSKGKGKNIYSLYNGEEFIGYESKRGEIDSLYT
ncbi:MAG: GGDEF domain-containing protein [Lachnospiraceae bacterium]